ncbi:MAG: hypothetical protein IJ560_03595 [Alphaproteobacteria bacterium]|nr:hypothetical protein [Alphaproteobacteria bacterium]
MFNDTIVVQSAFSAFNNAALFAPAFLWNAILAVPVFIMIWMYGNTFLGRIGWTESNTAKRTGITIAACIILWTVLFGGNYGILRDATSVLPFMCAAILFTCSYFIAAHARDISVPKINGMPRRIRIACIAATLAGAAIVGASDMHAWWGPILQIGAVMFGIFLGRVYRFTPSLRFGPMILMFLTSTVMLMQPEFFRFGQLGNLSLVHMGAIVIIGAAFSAAVATAFVRPRGRIYRSAYIKLKWLGRIVTILGIILFILTESVPVFLGLTIILWAMFALSVWHERSIAPDVPDRMIATTMISFGITTGIIVITALGIIMLSKLSDRNPWRDIRQLL